MSRMRSLSGLAAALALGLAGCGDFTSSGDPLSESEAAALAEALAEGGFAGFGAQGGGDLGPFFAAAGRGAVVNSSRGILYAGEGRPWPAWKEAMREAARAAHAAIERARRK